MLVRDVLNYRNGFPRERLGDAGMWHGAFEPVAAPFPDIAAPLAAEAGQPEPGGDDQAIERQAHHLGQASFSVLQSAASRSAVSASALYRSVHSS